MWKRSEVGGTGSKWVAFQSSLEQSFSQHGERAQSVISDTPVQRFTNEMKKFGQLGLARTGETHVPVEA